MSLPITIFFAEDHKLFRQLLTSSLKDYNIITIGEAEDGLQLIKLLNDVMPDIVLLDIEMPNLSGSETFEMIRKSYPSLKVIFLSTHFEELLMEHFISKGASAFLSKNNDIEVVAETIRLVYENKYIQAYSFSEKKFENGRKLKFSKRESEIIPLICAGKSNKEIAESLEIGNKAVEAHKNNLFKKTKTKSAAELINYIFKRGLNHLN